MVMGYASSSVFLVGVLFRVLVRRRFGAAAGLLSAETSEPEVGFCSSLSSVAGAGVLLLRRVVVRRGVRFGAGFASPSAPPSPAGDPVSVFVSASCVVVEAEVLLLLVLARRRGARLGAASV